MWSVENAAAPASPSVAVFLPLLVFLFLLPLNFSDMFTSDSSSSTLPPAGRRLTASSAAAPLPVQPTHYFLFVVLC